jgi:hypothetical protein
MLVHRGFVNVVDHDHREHFILRFELETNFLRSLDESIAPIAVQPASRRTLKNGRGNLERDVIDPAQARLTHDLAVPALGLCPKIRVSW